MIRPGVRGRRSSRILARGLNLGARSPMAGLMTRLHARSYRGSRGRIMSRWFGNPVLVIETMGRRSGKRRATAITYLPFDGRWVVMPINGGSDRVPAWWLNLEAAGEGVVLEKGSRTTVRPRVAKGEERKHLWRAYVDQAPPMEDYQSFTEREVPVVVLEPN
jgi:F420H(2)-dependent quinone reductase